MMDKSKTLWWSQVEQLSLGTSAPLLAVYGVVKHTGFSSARPWALVKITTWFGRKSLGDSLRRAADAAANKQAV